MSLRFVFTKCPNCGEPITEDQERAISAKLFVETVHINCGCCGHIFNGTSEAVQQSWAKRDKLRWPEPAQPRSSDEVSA